jgi:hypothetical protein
MARETSKGVSNLDDSSSPLSGNRTNHLLLIAIDEYENGIPRLSNAVHDARQFREILEKNYQFAQENIVELYDAQATSENILDTFDQLIQKLSSDDNLVLYFSGHGVFHKTTKRGYWLPANAHKSRRSTFFNNTEVTDFIRQLRVFHFVGIVDSCFSESLFDRMRAVDDEAAQRVESMPSRWLITAGRLEPVSDGSLGENSPFAHALHTLLRHHAEKQLWVSDVCSHLKKVVPMNAKQTPRGEPLPDVGHQGGEFIFRKKGGGAGGGISLEGEEKMPHEQVNAPAEQPQGDHFAIWVANLKETLQLDLDAAFVRLNEKLNRAGLRYNELVLLRARYNAAKTDQMRGTASASEISISMNRIRAALLDFIDSLRPEDLK